MVPCGEEGAALSLSYSIFGKKSSNIYVRSARREGDEDTNTREGREGRGAAPLSDGVDGAAAAADRVSNPRARPRGCEEAAAGSREGRREVGRPDADERTMGERELEDR